MILDRDRSDAGNKRRAVRRVNERIGARSESFAEDVCAEFVCECADERCFAVVPLTLAEWRAGTCEPGYFVVCPGHETAAEDVVVVGARYDLVRVDGWRDGEPIGQFGPPSRNSSASALRGTTFGRGASPARHSPMRPPPKASKEQLP